MNSSVSSAQNSLMLVESARYALLRRLAFSIRHQMVAHLQPIGMVTELLERRLRSPSPDLAQVHDSVAKINGLSKAAAQDTLDVITWMAPEPGATAPLDAVLKDTVTLLRGNFSFRGFALKSDVESLPKPVGRAAARMLLPAALLALTDTVEGPAEVLVTAQTREDVVLVDLQLRRTQGESFENQLSYRAITWPEVRALAAAEDVELSHTEDRASLAFPILE
ncbi:hypothetical protein EZ313_08805 [Ramlibacter henchirensis]|uniref:Histidine kinase n=1 Tax=Ramlibacter henchirensis TaxID=204072 RepID=A0A4Z0C9B9_9BURK|nr:hypothetical protein [Ramlibacter henchirensis]TFZ06705.1 hypothetical protein EZ313_08805 [Ramlibacter henchirensis]